jgi:hypothetical protein
VNNRTRRTSLIYLVYRSRMSSFWSICNHTFAASFVIAGISKLTKVAQALHNRTWHDIDWTLWWDDCMQGNLFVLFVLFAHSSVSGFRLMLSCLCGLLCFSYFLLVVSLPYGWHKRGWRPPVLDSQSTLRNLMLVSEHLDMLLILFTHCMARPFRPISAAAADTIRVRQFLCILTSSA